MSTTPICTLTSPGPPNGTTTSRHLGPNVQDSRRWTRTVRRAHPTWLGKWFVSLCSRLGRPSGPPESETPTGPPLTRDISTVRSPPQPTAHSPQPTCMSTKAGRGSVCLKGQVSCQLTANPNRELSAHPAISLLPCLRPTRPAIEAQTSYCQQLQQGQT